MSTVEVLRKARTELADPAKWHQGGYGHGTGTCLVGSVKVACGVGRYGDLFTPDVWAAVKVLRRLLGFESGLQGIFDFNDSPDTTHDEVLALLDWAIANEEAREAEFTASPIVTADSVVEAERVLQVQP